ncbi:hypothetical protein DB346_02850 [Verrucomicrobia bacterium LW23]|nr:hypothetical protein DB346_03805 [Verrucomicrobia bacterium LW23]PTY04387.1 hypothetical protein DB346_02850 [Verrucomicrobia bacterium LW23]
MPTSLSILPTVATAAPALPRARKTPVRPRLGRGLDVLIKSQSVPQAELPITTTMPPPPELRDTSAEAPRSPALVAQVRLACSPAHRLAMFCGALMGGIVAFLGYYIAHHEAPQHVLVPGWPSPLWILVAGALLFSAKTVWQFGQRAFNDRWKATGFVLILEGVMVFSSTDWLAMTALAYLIIINAIATGTNLALEDEISIK